MHGQKVATKVKIGEIREKSGNCKKKLSGKIKIPGFKEVQCTYVTSTSEYYRPDKQTQAVSATLFAIIAYR